ncbi:hypothetical protein [Clavibacter californiensis]|nr:hypothetical protein [Clavibacter californiensis]UKF78789.1 hypothetical protein FGD68_08165 [Clavibacter californiensis]
MSIGEEPEWNIWVRPRGRVPSMLTRAILRLSGVAREGIWGPWSATHLVLSKSELEDVIQALRSPHAREGEAEGDGVRLHLIKTIGNRLRHDKRYYRERQMRDVHEDGMMPEFVVPLIPGQKAARMLSRVLDAVPNGDRAVILDPRISLTFAFWRGSDLLFRDALMSSDALICDEEFRMGLIEDFERYSAELSDG